MAPAPIASPTRHRKKESIMRQFVVFAAALALLAGCEYQRQEAQRRQSNVWLAESVNDTAIRNAIIRQRTLYPYHFIEQGGQLNELGMQELEILTQYYRHTPGVLSVRRGGADNELYHQRVEHVRMVLEGRGVDLAHMQIEDRPAGGDGISGQRAVDILRAEREDEGAGRITASETMTLERGGSYADDDLE
jgi:hypothetical protein